MNRKKNLPVTFFMIFLFSIFIFTKMEAAAANSVAITKVNFPDDKFREYLKKFDLNSDNYFDQQEIDKVTVIDVQDSRITSLNGVEFFNNLLELSCGYNSIKELDVSRNTKLLKLLCYENPISYLDLSNNIDLANLDFHGTNLLCIDISQNIKLESVFGSFPNGRAIDVTSINTNTIKGFDMSRTYNWQNATVNGNIVTITDFFKPVTYQYYVGLGRYMDFAFVYNGTDRPVQKEASITVAPSFSKVNGDKPFSLNATMIGDGKMQYSSSNDRVAMVSDDGIVTIGNAGETIITISAELTMNYTGVSVDVLLTVAENETTIDADSFYVLNYNDDPFYIDPMTNGDGEFRFESRNPKIATVSNDGLLTPTGVGSTTIEISTTKTNSWAATSFIIDVEVKGLKPTISTSSSTYSKVNGDKPFSLNAATSGDGDLTFYSSNPTVATVSSDGLVSLHSVGTSRIMITSTATSRYQSASVQVMIDVRWNGKLNTISGFSPSYTKVYGDKPFPLNAKIDGNGVLSFNSSNPKVATVSNSGIVTINGVGTTTITISCVDAISQHVSITVEKKIVTIYGFSPSYTKVYGDKPFPLNAKTDGNGVLSFNSSNTKVATVSNNGIVTITGAGTSTITISSPDAVSKTVSIKVGKRITTISGCASSYTKTYGDKPFPLNAKTDGNGVLSFNSSNTKVATVTNSGMVTVKGIGTATIKISTGSTANCEAASKNVTVSVKAKTTSITGVASSYDKTYGDRPFTVKPKVSGNRKISCSSSNKRVFIVDSRGKVTIKGCGKATLTLTSASSNGYSRVTKKVTLTVKPKKMAITVSAKRKSFLQINWKRDSKVKGYQISCAKDSKFKKSPVIQNITGYKTTSKTLKKGKGTYYVRVRSYVLSGNTKIYSSYSSTKKVTVK